MSTGHRIALGAAAVAAAVGTYRALWLPAPHDVGWLLHVSGRVLDGATLYSDVIEINPPLIVWLGVPVVALARATGASALALFAGFVAIAALVSLTVSYRLSRHVLAERFRPALLVATAAALFLVRHGEWGQREHLMIVLCFPYIVACAMRARGTVPPHAWLIGIAGGIGFALKPHFLLAFVVLEAWLARRATGRAMPVAAAATMTLYGASVLLFTNYLSAAWALREFYASFAHKTLADMATPVVLTLVAPLLLVFARGEGRELRLAVGLASAAWFVMAIAQLKGFGYHFLPATAGAVVLMTLAAIGAEQRGIRRGAALAIALLTTLALASQPLGRDLGARRAVNHTAKPIIAGQPVVILSASLRDVWPLVAEADAQWLSPMSSAWTVVLGPAGVKYAADRFAPALSHDPIALVPKQPTYDALPALLTDSAFRRAWDGYEEVGETGFYLVFRRRVE